MMKVKTFQIFLLFVFYSFFIAKENPFTNLGFNLNIKTGSHVGHKTNCMIVRNTEVSSFWSWRHGMYS